MTPTRCTELNFVLLVWVGVEKLFLKLVIYQLAHIMFTGPILQSEAMIHSSFLRLRFSTLTFECIRCPFDTIQWRVFKRGGHDLATRIYSGVERLYLGLKTT